MPDWFMVSYSVALLEAGQPVTVILKALIPFGNDVMEVRPQFTIPAAELEALGHPEGGSAWNDETIGAWLENKFGPDMPLLRRA
jgi:hypothetical protein